MEFLNIDALKARLLNDWLSASVFKEDTGYLSLGYRMINEKRYSHFQRFFPPANDSDIAAMENRIGRMIPDEWKSVLKQANGFNLFDATVTFFGANLLANRSPNPHGGDAILLDYGNLFERPDGLPDDYFCIGGMVGYTASGYLFLAPDGHVELRRNWPYVEIGEKWESIEACINDQIDRLSKHYDNQLKNLVTSTKRMPPSCWSWEDSDD